jgi:lipoprotein-anchoring transpeptidase ErfK/SrfK
MSRKGISWIIRRAATAGAIACIAVVSTVALAGPLRYEALPGQVDRPLQPVTSDSTIGDDKGASLVIPTHLRRRLVNYPSTQAPGTIVVDTPNTYLYYVMAGGKAIRYGIGVGREGFTWSGTKTVDHKSEWPDWIPPVEMIQRQPYLPRFMAGGPQNPLGARAIYLGESLYRIHGTNAPSTIGKHVSSGCIRMLNEDVIDLYARVSIGTKVVVLPMTAPQTSEIAGGVRLSGIHVPAGVINTVRMSGIY